MRYFTWKLEFVSNILWMNVDGTKTQTANFVCNVTTKNIYISQDVIWHVKRNVAKCFIIPLFRFLSYIYLKESSTKLQKKHVTLFFSTETPSQNMTLKQNGKSSRRYLWKRIKIGAKPCAIPYHTVIKNSLYPTRFFTNLLYTKIFKFL